MQAIGDRLREARMRQKIDIAEVESATKIRAKYLRALENEEFGLLPGSTFVKSFLRTYAEYLGLDPHLLVEEYRAQHEPREHAELQPFGTQPPQGRERRSAPGPPGPGALIVGLIVLVLVGLAILGLTGEDDGGNGDEQQSEEARPEREEREERTGREREAAPRTVRLRVSPAGETYVCVDDGDGNVKFEDEITEPATYRGRRVRILLGRRAVELSANGERVRVPGGSEPIAYDFSRGKRRQIPLAQAPCA